MNRSRRRWNTKERESRRSHSCRGNRACCHRLTRSPASQRMKQVLLRSLFTFSSGVVSEMVDVMVLSEGMVTMAAPSPLMLGLGLGLGTGPGASKPVFTYMQLQELEHQALIYKYMAAGLPVPGHLVLPIWKSVAASSFGAYHYPSCLIGYGSLCLDYRNSMEPEPGRCRRTDGKKWRCSRHVVPDQKYCERHMHRGRNRSRKPMEAAATRAAAAASTPPSCPSRSRLVGGGCCPPMPPAAAAEP
ncbi:hypothetical protein BHE74_00045875 [Ensete ventricosum]|nr:hypothetical protein GW17_00058473 [Ensete ventricosum]RWW48083.1 hypothetical protein BHE74_00045875 [Ensete ventricosum]RZS24868.1 hypothetical protein BHM03_00057994 [Ensete ventricosum]